MKNKKILFLITFGMLFIIILGAFSINYAVLNANKAVADGGGHTHDYSVRQNRVSPATCTSPEKYVYKCKKCSSTTTKYYGSALGHDYTVRQNRVSPATCTSPEKYVYKCKRCSSTTTKYYGSAVGHKPGSWKSDDYQHYQECSVCKKIINTGTHVKVTETTKAVTDTTSKIERVKCKICNRVLNVKTIPNDNSSNNTTTTNNNTSNVVTINGSTNTTDHEHVYQYLRTVKATCTTNGYDIYKCTKCSATTKRNLDRAEGHSPSANWSYNNSGMHWKVCSKCKQNINVSAHKLNSTLVKKATCQQEGQVRISCSVCQYTTLRKIQKTGHVYSASAGYSSDPDYHYLHCKVCDTVQNKGTKHIWNSTTGTCSICRYVCKHPFYKNNVCTKCGYKRVANCNNHELIYRIDKYGHYISCSKCGLMVNAGDTSHKFDTKLLNDDHSKHVRVCTICGYIQKIEAHTWNSQDYCIYCNEHKSVLNSELTSGKVVIISDNVGVIVGCTEERIFTQPDSNKVFSLIPNENTVYNEEEIKYIQSALNIYYCRQCELKGIPIDKEKILSVDGVYGKNTHKAFVKFIEDIGYGTIATDEAIVLSNDIPDKVYNELKKYEAVKFECEVVGDLVFADPNKVRIDIVDSIHKCFKKNGISYNNDYGTRNSDIMNIKEWSSDCAASETSSLYYLACAYNIESAIIEFSTQHTSVYYKNLLNSGGVRFDSPDGFSMSISPVKDESNNNVPIGKLQPGYMLVYDGHVETYMGGDKLSEIQVYNAGNTKDMMSGVVTIDRTNGDTKLNYLGALKVEISLNGGNNMYNM